MKKPEAVTDDKGNIYIVPGQMTREEAEVYFPNQPERSKREDVFVVKVSNECIAIDAIPSKECREYHENSYIQINGQLRRCGALNTQETE
jgi:hypothetical protein